MAAPSTSELDLPRGAQEASTSGLQPAALTVAGGLQPPAARAAHAESLGRLGQALHLLRVYVTLVRLRYRTRLMYPAAYYSFLLAKLVGYVSEYAVLWLLLDRFKSIAGWTLPEVLLLHSLNVVSYTVAASFTFHVARNIESYVVTGELDAVLLKPMHPLLWLSGFFYSPTYISQTILGLGVLLWAASQLGLGWTPAIAGALLVMLLGASFLQAALFLLSSSVTFWTTRGRNIASALLSLRGLVDFPVSIYGPTIRLILTFVVPVAFINYYPGGLLLDRPEYGDVRPLVVASPAVGIGLFLLSLWLWHRALRAYSGAGS